MGGGQFGEARPTTTRKILACEEKMSTIVGHMEAEKPRETGLGAWRLHQQTSP